MKKLLSGLLAVTMLAGSCDFRLNNCEASSPIYFDSYQKGVGVKSNSMGNKINFEVGKDCTVTYSKDKNKVKVERKGSGFIWSTLKKIVLIGGSALAATILVRNSDKAKNIYQVIKESLNSTAGTFEEAFDCGKCMLAGDKCSDDGKQCIENKCPETAVCNSMVNAEEKVLNIINSFLNPSTQTSTVDDGTSEVKE